jgi:peptidoglycan/xylan/chitin deacetylase (PgdA/CDA1 family)
VLYHRDGKDLVEESRSYWYHGGRLAAYRLLTKGQRSAQVAWLSGLQRFGPARKLKLAMAREHPGLFLAGGRAAGRIADRTGSLRAFRLWQRLESPVESWRSIREDGASPEALREAVGAPLLVLAIHDAARALHADDREYSLSGERLRDLLRLLRWLGFSSVAAGDGIARPQPRQYALTLDGGYSSVYREVFPLVQSDALRPLVFLVVDRLGGFNTWDWRMGHRVRQMLSPGQIREMHRYGVQFGSQSCTHPWLPTVTDRDLETEVAGSKQKLEDLLGEQVTSFAYPYGGVNARVRAAVARAGYQWGFSTRPGLSFWDDPLRVRRVGVSEADSSFTLLLKALTGRSPAQHAYRAIARRPYFAE